MRTSSFLLAELTLGRYARSILFLLPSVICGPDSDLRLYLVLSSRHAAPFALVR
jgi:hypothetical protein